MTDIEAGLEVDDGAGGERALSVNDFKTAATGAAKESTQLQVLAAVQAADTARNADDDALRTLVSDRLVAAILTDPVVDAVAAVEAKLTDDPATETTAAAVRDNVATAIARLEAIRDRLPTALNGDGGVPAHVTNFPATQAISAAALPLPAGAATEVSLADLVSRVGPTASDTLLSLLRQVVTNTATEAAKVTHLDLTADTLNLSTDNVEGLLTTLNALVASESTLAALRTANHTDLVALATALATLNAKDFATQTTSAAILAKLSADPATQTTLAAFVTANHTDLAAILAKNEAIRALLAGTLLVESSTPLVTAATYSGGLVATYTQTRALDSKTRTITVTRNGDGTIATQSATAWA